MQHLEHKDKLLKIFSRVRCFNKDQLPRYVDGRLTHVEKHLLEQHLVNCGLCSDAVEILQKSKFKTQYQPMGLRVQQYIRNSTYTAPQVYEAERYQKKVQINENFLTYFWGTVAAALLIGCFYLAQQQVKKEKVATSFARIEPDHRGIAAQPLPIVTADSAAATSAIREDGTAMKNLITAADRSGNSPDSIADTDKFLYKTAMTYYHDGNLDEAMNRFTQLTTDTTSRYRELAHYQLAMCFKFKRQKAKARNMLKELVNMNGRMKRRAQLALNNL